LPQRTAQETDFCIVDDEGYGAGSTFLGERFAGFRDEKTFTNERTLTLNANPDFAGMTEDILKRFGLDDIELGWVFANYS